MKKIVFIIYGVLVILNANAQTKAFASCAPQGNFIFCGMQLPKSFQYLIERKEQSNWDTIALLSFPESKEAFIADALHFQNRYYNAIAMDENDAWKVWKKLNDYSVLDSGYAYAINTCVKIASGTGFMDVKAKKGVKYQYRVSQIQIDKSKELYTFKDISYPGAQCNAKLIPFSINVIDQIVNADFHLLEDGNMAGCQVFRAYYLRSAPAPIEAQITFTKDGLKNLVSIRDEHALPKIAYSYYLVPMDPLGNPGNMSEPLNLYNSEPKTIQASVNGLKSKSLNEEAAIEISWNPLKDKDVISIEIFKSDIYDGNYKKLISLSPSETKYIDRSVEPIKTYYYSMVLNGKFERSIPSARVSAMLEASEPNDMPPQNLRAGRINNKIVMLTWNRVEERTRGYYIYRGFNNDMPEKYSPLILSDSNTISYIDTITSNESGYYSYAVVDVNTSYRISALSNIEKVSIDETILPMVSNLKVGKINGQVTVIWDNMRMKSNQVTGYHLYKKIVDEEGNMVSDWQQVNKEKISYDKNMYIDLNLKEGQSVYYSAACVGLTDSIIGDQSMPVVFTINQFVPSPPLNVQAYQNGDAVSVLWNKPIDEQVDKIKVYRALKNDEPQVLTTLSAVSAEYVDKSVKKGNTYFYFVVSESKSGIQSRYPEAIGVKVN